MATENEQISLFNGKTMPIVGLGTFAPQEGEDGIIEAVKSAVRAGYRHIDCAAIYRNERAVGHAIHELIVMGTVKREDLFITSKLWNTNHRPDLVLPNLEKTLDDLGLDYIDMYLIHWPVAYKEGGDMIPKDENGKLIFGDVDYVDTWQALEDCVDMGKARHIGLSNFNSKQISRVMEIARVQPAVLQVEVNCYMSNRNLIDFARSKGILVVAFGPLGTPSMTPKDIFLLHDPVVGEIAKAHDKTPAQVALRFLIQQGLAVVPKSVTPKRIEENYKVFDFMLSEEEMDKLFSLNKNHRNYSKKVDSEDKNYPFHEEF